MGAEIRTECDLRTINSAYGKSKSLVKGYGSTARAACRAISSVSPVMSSTTVDCDTWVGSHGSTMYDRYRLKSSYQDACPYVDAEKLAAVDEALTDRLMGLPRMLSVGSGLP